MTEPSYKYTLKELKREGYMALMKIIMINKEKVQKLLNQIGPEQLMAVTKYSSRGAAQELVELGIKHLGESRLQDLQSKYDQTFLRELKAAHVHLHFIGHLQGNKVSKVLQICDQIDSVDSFQLINKINQVSGELQKAMPIMLQINLVEEEQKYGFSQLEIETALEEIQSLPNLDLKGFMCMGKKDAPEETRIIFKRCRQLADDYGLSEVSMGMSADYEIARDEGSTMLRIGRVLVEE